MLNNEYSLTKSHLHIIKHAQKFEFIGEFFCLMGTTLLMYLYIYNKQPICFFIASLCMSLGNISMIIQSIITINIPNKIKHNDINIPIQHKIINVH